MKKYALLLIAVAFKYIAVGQDKPAYILYNQEGKPVTYSSMLEKMKKADIVFFGEQHTDPIAHWLQLELTKDLYSKKEQDLILGAEMFEADNQLIMNEYLAGVYATEKFEAEIRLWGNYQTDYKPLVEFAKENQLLFVATNIPRRYASIVHKKGFEGLEALTEEAKKYFAPLPFNYDPEVKCYKDMMNMKEMGGHVNENFPKAQAAKDATMAHFILQNWSEGKLFLHYNGSYHSDNFEGIVWHLIQENKDLKIITISTVTQNDISSLEEENLNSGNYILCVPENMTKTKR